MATIALYANKVNQMPKLVQGVKSAINDYKTELLQLQMKAFSIGESVCNLNDVISSIQSSTQTQDEKVSSFDTLEQNTEEFIETASSVDRNVADIINQQRAEFYKNYAYLKPECEKNTWDKFRDGCERVGEWCEKNLESITAILVAGIIIGGLIAVSVISFGSTAVLLAAVVGAIANTVGQFIGDCITSIIIGKWSPSSTETYIGAFIGGGVGGIITLLTGGNAVAVSSVSASVSSLITGHLENITGKEKKTSLEILFESGTTALWAGVIAKAFPVKIKGITKGRNSFEAVFKGVLTKLKNGNARRYSRKTIAKGVVASITGDLLFTWSGSLFSSIRIKWEEYFENSKRSKFSYE